MELKRKQDFIISHICYSKPNRIQTNGKAETCFHIQSVACHRLYSKNVFAFQYSQKSLALSLSSDRTQS